MELKEVMDDIQQKPTVPVWPHLGLALGISRGAVYSAVGRGEFEVIRVGRCIKAITAPLRKRLGL